MTQPRPLSMRPPSSRAPVHPPDADAPVPEFAFTGRCEAALERAVVRYRGLDEVGLPGGRSSDLGVGVVLSEPRQGMVRVLDLGSGETRETELSPPLVVLGWLFSRPFQDLVSRCDRGPAAISGPAVPLARPFLSRLPLSVETRPIFLRAGFRDVAMDLDPHESTSVRLSLGVHGVCRLHLDYDQSTLVVRSGKSEPVVGLVEALTEAFPPYPLYRVHPGAGRGATEIHLVLPELSSVQEIREGCAFLRRGILHLMARFDLARHQDVLERLQGFGERDLLGQLVSSGSVSVLLRRERISVVPAPGVSGRIH